MGLYDDFLKQINKRMDENKVKEENSNRRAYNSDRGREVIKNSVLPSKKEYSSSESVNNNANLTIAEEFKRQLESGKRVEPTNKLPIDENFKSITKRTLQSIGKDGLKDLPRIAGNAGYGLGNGLIDFDARLNRAVVSEIEERYKQDFDSINLNDTDIEKKLYEISLKNRDTYDNVRNLWSAYNEQKNGGNKITNALQKQKQVNNQRIQENIEQSSNFATKKLAELTPSIGQMTPSMIPIVGSAYAIGSSQQAYYEEALQRGMSKEDANNYGNVMGLLEGGAEFVGGKITKSIGKNLAKGATKQASKMFALDVAENIAEEAVMEPLSELTTKFTGGDKFLKNDYHTLEGWAQLGKDMLDSGINGGIVAMIMGGASASIGSSANIVNKIKNKQKISVSELQIAQNDIKNNLNNKNLQQKLQEAQNIVNNLQEQQIIQEQNELAQNGNMGQLKIDSENFAKQVDNVQNIKENSALTVLSKTPQIYKDLGLNDLPMTITKNHTIWAMSDKSSNNSHLHGLAENIVKQIPKALNNPLNVLKSGSRNDSIVAITELADNEGNLVVVPIKVNGRANVNEIEIDANVLTSIYGKDNNYDGWMQDNIQKGRMLYDIDEGIMQKIGDNPPRLQLSNDIVSNEITGTRLQSPRTSNSNINNSITFQNKNVNYNYSMQNLQNNAQNKQSLLPTQQINQGQNKMAQNGNMNVPIENYKYEKTDSVKINNLRQDMSKYWANTEKVKALGSTIEKIIKDKGYNVRLDNNIANKNGQSVNAQISTLSNGEVEIKINPNAKNVGEFLLMHETTHAIETQEMKNLVLDYARKNKGFNDALESLKQTYGTEDVSSEVVADISGQLFGNQEFINSLSMEKPNVFKRIYNKIIELANKITGNSHEALFIRDLKNKWEEAYRTQSNNLNNNSYYSIQQDNNGNRYVKVDTDQDIFDGIDRKDYNKIAKIYIQDYLMGKTTLGNNDSTVIDNRSASKYTNPQQRTSYMNEKMQLTPELKNVLKIAEKDSASLPTKENSKYKSWEYYKFKFELGEKKFEGTVNIGIDKDGNKHFYEINKIRFTGISSVSTNSQHKANFINNSILPTNENVNSTDRYSMQNTEKNSLPTKEWTEHLNNNYNATGTRTDLADIKVPTREYFENKETSQFLSDEDLNVLNKIYEKEGTTEVFTEKKKAKILEKYAKDKYSFKDSLDMLAQKIVNKGHYVDKLSKSSKNPALKFMYDRSLNSFAEGQYVVGIAQTDNNGNSIGKSINDIWKPVEDSKLSKEFDEYLLHKLNIDRAERNKYVFGEDIKPADSTAIALELESKHPEFKEWAKDIKEFNHNNMLNLKEAGLIDEDTINYLESMYPNYVPISRTVDEQIFTGNADKTGTALPIKSATGGNADIQPVKDAMAMQAIRIKRLINQNNLGIELAKSLKNAKVEAGFDTTWTPDVLLNADTLVETDSSGNKFYTYFEDGKMQKLRINDNLYKSLKPTEISDIEKSLPARGLQKLTNINRSLLTSSNPLFIVTNFFKDFQDGMFNSKYSSKFIKNYGKALNEIVINGKYYESYMANGGMTNSYFDYEEGVKKKYNKFVEKIRDANEIVEQLPRLAEFISTVEDGKSLNEALYNAAEITTNFKRGGELTKALNRNGWTFLNASVQGFDKFYRNFSGQNGAKGYVNLAIKATLLGVVPSVLNHILLDDDEDYQDLPQSTKDLYYLFKYDDGKFIRIPKGRMLSVFGGVARRSIESVKGQDDAWDGFGSTIINQIGPNNPFEDNIAAPIKDVILNKTWYDSDLVSSRLQKELPKNQYDETTDEFSKWIGNKLNVSPKKVNYLLDQYSGGIGDVLLPMITPQAKENVVVDKFTTDSVLKNKNVSKFYETLDKQTQIANDSFATDEDQLQLKYLNEMSQDIGKLYKEKRDIQMSSVSQAEKRNKVRVVQGKIDELCEEALKNYKDVKVDGNTAKSRFSSFYKDSEGEWKELTEAEEGKNKDISLKSYADYKNTVYEKKQSKIKSGELKKGQDLKDKDKIQVLLDSNYSNKEISAIYENYILSSNNKSFKAIKASGIDIKAYLKYVQQEFKADKTDDGTTKGKTVSNSKKSKEYDYVNNMNISYEQRLLLLGFNYTLNNGEQTKLAHYVNNLEGLNKEERMSIFEQLNGFTVYKDGRIKW